MKSVKKKVIVVGPNNTEPKKDQFANAAIVEMSKDPSAEYHIIVAGDANKKLIKEFKNKNPARKIAITESTGESMDIVNNLNKEKANSVHNLTIFGHGHLHSDVVINISDLPKINQNIMRQDGYVNLYPCNAGARYSAKKNEHWEINHPSVEMHGWVPVPTMKTAAWNRRVDGFDVAAQILADHLKTDVRAFDGRVSYRDLNSGKGKDVIASKCTGVWGTLQEMFNRIRTYHLPWTLPELKVFHGRDSGSHKEGGTSPGGIDLQLNKLIVNPSINGNGIFLESQTGRVYLISENKYHSLSNINIFD